MTLGSMLREEELRLERLRVKAKKSIGETEELIEERITQLRQLIEMDETLRLPDKKFDGFLLGVLRAKKFNLEKAFKVYRKFCVLRHHTKNVAEHCRPQKYEEFLKKYFVCQVKNRDAHGRSVVLIQARHWDPVQYDLDQALAMLFLVFFEAMEHADSQLHGFVILVDFKGFSLTHARHATPSRIQHIVQFLQDSYPASFKEIHFFNHPFIFNMLFSVAKPFIKEKMRKRIYFHGHDIRSVQNSFHPSTLPEYLGGKLHDNDYADLVIVNNLLSKEEHILEAKMNICLDSDYC